ncbi:MULTISPECIES: CheR family methyltransferase [unclassified Rhizobium]|uniref:CheR family methyltransferase n=1 Tax=unclassified Rhizobium TaxID=2613769 RepID=UPI0007EA8DC1|nr:MULTISPECIES: CheR family methyltransferase [unclassified Rhizobium]ANM12175.1 methyl-accepting chemotaxis protein O-methyltransferase 2 [Rhizobium sp. N324]ANM18578.1 methyl-accepting chemotaxis protein O-methyltransferase 2 [Rhizobium sp. N541]ANM24964.1 methyl-accepting chemotaxis protein O-methyltransferase 2 [Rhizobium sp. N941]OYD05693.1 methyl-accepting chemotaxis protein O-methyltransferase 2 [Rhizobium sp. N4311]
MSMAAAVETQLPGDRISKRNFEKLARFIYDYSGIKMPPTKLTMLEGRLRRRLRATNHSTFDDYCDFLFNQDGLAQESVYLIDVVTTNKTDFFREAKHFDYMQSVALPAIAGSGVRTIRTWSSACSTGAEPYTMAMVLAEFTEGRNDLSYSVLATDLSTDVLQTARRGIYPEDLIAPVPRDLQRKYVLTAKRPDRREVRITPKLRSRIGFARMNLMDEKYLIGEPMHVIFCRNVLIYFDKQTQAGVLNRLCGCLAKGGYIFIGHSESITGFDLPLKQVSNTVFQRI